MNQISVPDCWEELTDYQQREIIHIISHTDTEDFTEQYMQIVQILLMKKGSIWERIKMRRILKNIPISNFSPALKFISEEPKLHHFPEIKGLVKPAVRMGDITIEQFSVCDTLFYRYQTEKKEVYLRQLVAALYRLDPKSESKEPKFDKKSGMSALVIGNKETKKVEIIFGASQGLSNIFLIDGEKGKRARQDWLQNDLPSTIFTPDTQRAAKKLTYQVKEKYKNGYNGYKELTTVNGHSKAGGEAIYSASHIPGLKCFAIDPAPVTDCGRWINQNNLLTMVPNMGNGFIAATEKVEGTEFHTLKIKPSVSNKNVFKTLALPVECNDKGEHFPDNEMSVDRLRELQKYANKVEKKLEEQTRYSNTKNNDIIENVR